MGSLQQKEIPMTPLQANEVLDLPTLAFIRRKAQQLIRRPGFIRADREDLQQELIVRLLKRLPAFDPSRGDRHAFVKTVIERAAATLAKSRKAAKRNPCRETSLHVLVPDEGGGQAELGHTFVEDAHCRRLGTTRLSDQERFELSHDLAAALTKLPPDLRDVARRLQNHSKADVARELSIPRTTLNDLCHRIRQFLECTGLGTVNRCRSMPTQIAA